MIRTGVRAAIRVVLAACALWLGSVTLAAAQAPTLEAPAIFETLDANHVDLATRTLQLPLPTVSIGPSDGGGLAFAATMDETGAIRHNLQGGVIESCLVDEHLICQTGSNYVIVTVSGFSPAPFYRESNGTFTPLTAASYSLTESSGTWTYTMRDGSVAVFGPPAFAPFTRPRPGPAPPESSTWSHGAILSLTRPSGEVTTYHYAEIHGGSGPYKLVSVTNNFGYQIHIEYAASTATVPLAITSVTAINNAVEYCDPEALTCTLTNDWPTLTFGSSYSSSPVELEEINVTDSLSRTTRYFFDHAVSQYGPIRVSGVRLPTSSSGQDISYGYRLTNYIYHFETVTTGTDVWTYSTGTTSGTLPGLKRVRRTDPLDHTIIVDTFNAIADDLANVGGGVVRYENGEDEVTIYDYDNPSAALGYLLTEVTMPEGNSTTLEYDARGNLVERTSVAKSGSGLSDIVVTADYPTACSNIITCNQPDSVTDARGYRTDITYDSTHGGVLTITQPAPTGSTPIGSGTQSQTRYSYSALYAWTRNSSGNLVQQSSAIYRLIGASQCAISSSCAGQAEEIVTAAGYQAGSTSVESNLLPVTASSGSGDAGLTAMTTTTWTDLGDPASVEGPRTGTSDVTHYRYDAMRERIGMIGAAPVSGDATRPATRTSYNASGQVTNVEQGTVEGLTDTDWGNFITLQSTASIYDSIGRKVRDTFSMGGVVQRVTQYTYDAANRLDCTAVRMNPGVFGSLPSSACTLGTEGANGPDRITRTTYDDADRPTIITSAYGTSLAQPTRTQAYTANGQIDWVEDANGNRSDYAYDGFDRLYRLYFPSPTTAHTPNTSDYEQHGYDANNNRVSLRLRSGDSDTIRFHYDNLNRQCFKDLPSHVSNPTACGTDISGAGGTDVFYAYDLTGRQLSARFASVSGDGIVYTYDALSRVQTETETWNSRALAYQYDLGSNRTRVTYPDSNYIDYTYDVLNRMSEVRENGATSGAGLLGVYSHDFLSRPTELEFGNGTSTALTYDADSQDWSYQQVFPGDAPSDIEVGFARNPAAQTLTRMLDTDETAYSWEPAALNQTYTPNGLNQYTAVGGATITNDTRGNLTDDGTRAFCYDLENRLVGAAATTDDDCSSPTLTLEYDPLGRLRTTDDGTTETTFLYAGDQLVSEYVGSTLEQRYAFAAGVDRPIVWYEGSGLTTRHWLHADELGSVISTSDNDGEATVYSYGPYGEPDDTNGWTGVRFRYTGQIMLPEAQLYHYKARVYDPGLGRFLQTDPVGYADDLNLYGYAGNDPVGTVDPFGREKLILFGEHDPDLRAAAERAPEQSGVLNIYAHGSARTVGGGNDAHALAALIQASGQWQPGMPIILHACRTADTRPNNPGERGASNPIARQLAMILQTDVVGANSPIRWRTGGLFPGEVGPFEPLRDEAGQRKDYLTSNTPGQWVLFSADGSAQTLGSNLWAYVPPPGSGAWYCRRYPERCRIVPVPIPPPTPSSEQ